MGNYPHHIQIIADSNTWIEDNAVAQLETAARLPHTLRVVGMPDLHTGRGYPVSVAFFSDHRFCPALIGNDIDYGVAFRQIDLRAAKLKPTKLAKQLDNIGTPLDKDEQAELLGDAVDIRQFSDGLAIGTIGGDNHFVELQIVDAVYRTDLLPLDFDENHLQLLAHSGSRGLGQQILQYRTAAFGHQGLAEEGEATAAYLAGHQAALEFVSLNRRLIAARMLDRWRTEGTYPLDVHYSFLERVEIDGTTGRLHRRGAAPTDKGSVMIPGSRGDYGYLIQPAEDCQIPLNTLAHGAGRKWQRGGCKGRLSYRYTVDSLRWTEFGSAVVCQDRALVFEKAPQAYKSIDSVIAAMKNAGLIELVARFKPVLIYKTGGECGA